MANDDFLMNEEEIPENWAPVDATPSAPAVTNRVIKPKFFSGSLPPNLQHDSSFVGTEPPSYIPKNALMPFGNQSNPFTNAAATSTSKIVAQQVVAGSPSGIKTIGLVVPPALFIVPPSGSPLSPPGGNITLLLAPTQANFFFAGPTSTQGTIGFDSTVSSANVDGNRTSASLTIVDSTSQANDFALFCVNQFSPGTASVVPPDSSWTAIQALIAGTTLNLGVYWNSVPSIGTVSATIGLTNGSSAPLDLVGAIATFKSTGTPTSRQSRSTTLSGVTPGTASTLAYTSNTLAGSASFVIISGFTAGINEWAVSDSQNNQYALVAYSSSSVDNGTFQRSIYIFAAPSTTAAADTVTITYVGTSASASAAVVIDETTGLIAPVFTPVFRAITTADLPGMASGQLDVFHGGTAANLTGTGGPNQVVQQTTVGGPFTVGQLANKNLVGYAATSQKAESAADASVLSFIPPAVAGSYRLRFVMSVSAANAATLGWTATWKDSNGNAQTPTNLALFQEGTALPALTFTTSAAGDYYGYADIDIDASATSIVVKLTFTGTSFAAKVSATIERLI